MMHNRRITTQQRDVAQALNDGGGILRRRDHPELATSISWLVHTGRLLPVLPGIYTLPERATDPMVRIRAAARWAPDGALVGAAAAKLTFWGKVDLTVIELALSRQSRARPPGFRLTRRLIPDELITERQGLRFTVPALTALDLAADPAIGGEAIDNALRSRKATLSQLRRAIQLSPHRSGNRVRRQLLFESRAKPWSAAERLAHKILHAAGIIGWKGNWKIRVDGQSYYIDIAFPELRLAIEIDGRLHEDDEDLFESDRRRQNRLVLDGWRVLRFTWAMLNEEPDLVLATIVAAMSQ